MRSKTTKQPAKNHKQTIGKPSVWVCSCGCVIPKKDATLSGGPQYKQGYHVHCPQCAKILAQFINPQKPDKSHKWTKHDLPKNQTAKTTQPNQTLNNQAHKCNRHDTKPTAQTIHWLHETKRLHRLLKKRWEQTNLLHLPLSFQRWLLHSLVNLVVESTVQGAGFELTNAGKIFLKPHCRRHKSWPLTAFICKAIIVCAIADCICLPQPAQPACNLK